MTAPARTQWPSPLERRIAIRYLRGRKASTFTALNTKIATAGVAIGVAAMLVVLGIMNGLHDDLRDKILVGNPHLHVLTFGPNLRLDNWREVIDSVKTEDEVVAAGPEVVIKSLGLNSSNYPAAIDVVGFDPDTGSAAVTTLPYTISKGGLSFQPTQDSVDGAILLGYRLAERLSSYVGDVVTLISSADFTKRNRVTGYPDAKAWRFEVTGTFETGMYQYDDQFAVLRLDVAQQFAGLGAAVSGVQVRLQDPWKAREVGRRIENRLGYPIRTVAWQDQNASLFGALKLEKLGMALIITFITVVAAFNIIGTLTMIVGEKTREIGVLLAMGLTPRSIGRVFLTQGTAIGVIGTAVGIALGLALGFVLDESRLIRIDPSIYFIDHLPVHIRLLDALAVIGVSMSIAILATLPASRWAGRLQPVDAIRHE
jgi:lipoprotein-releasing system permease protein